MILTLVLTLLLAALAVLLVLCAALIVHALRAGDRRAAYFRACMACGCLLIAVGVALDKVSEAGMDGWAGFFVACGIASVVGCEMLLSPPRQ